MLLLQEASGNERALHLPYRNRDVWGWKRPGLAPAEAGAVQMGLTALPWAAVGDGKPQTVLCSTITER